MNDRRGGILSGSSHECFCPFHQVTYTDNNNLLGDRDGQKQATDVSFNSVLQLDLLTESTGHSVLLLLHYLDQ